MDSQCLMVNCRNKAPDDEAFCAKHRDTRMRNLEDIPHAELLVRLATANEVIAEQLEIRKRLEEERQTHLDAITQLGAIIARLREEATQARQAERADVVKWMVRQSRETEDTEDSVFWLTVALLVERGEHRIATDAD